MTLGVRATGLKSFIVVSPFLRAAFFYRMLGIEEVDKDRLNIGE